jgi:hypothetical protein
MGKMKIVDTSISLEELKKMAEAMFGEMVKAVVDVKREIMGVDAELHADQEAVLIEGGSRQEDLWGINLYPDLKIEEWIEYDSMINLKPSQDNRTRGVDDPDIRSMIIRIVNSLVSR